jgi:ribonuclease-3
VHLAHEFRDPALAELALTHRSAGRPNNERLEFLGDALLNAFVAELLFEHLARADEGELTRQRAMLVNGQALAQLARELDIGPRLHLGPGEMKSGGQRRDSILADAFEALLAAVYLDAGLEACRALVRTLFKTRVAMLEKSAKDAKTRLQEWLQQRALGLPQYELVHSSGSDHAPHFEVDCVLPLPEPRHFNGAGSSRRAAEQEAAAHALAAVLERRA